MREQLIENYKKSLATDKKSDEWSSEEPTVITKWPKSERLAHPNIGIIHGANSYSSVLDLYCQNYNQKRDSHCVPQVGPQRTLIYNHPKLLTNLVLQVKNICSIPIYQDHESLIEFKSSVLSQNITRNCPIYRELEQFIINLSSFLNGCYVSKSNSIELFQKQLIMHTFYFLISIKSPETTNQLFYIFREHFGLNKMEHKQLQTFKQRSSVFLIPRRHGKTWIVVAIISMILASVENIHIGYVAHQKHVANSVFTEIINTLYRWFPVQNIDIKKENGIITYKQSNKKSSTLMCATCFNKNVSIPFLVFDNHKLLT